MTNRGSDYQRMRKGESKKMLAIIQSRKDSKSRGPKLKKINKS